MHIAGKKITLTGATGGIGKALLSLLGSAADIQLIKRDTHGDLVDNLETICNEVIDTCLYKVCKVALVG